MNAFRFVGKLEFNAIDSKNPYIRFGQTKKGADYCTLSFSVAPTKNNRAYVERYGQVEKSIKTKDTDGNDIEVAWDDREDKDVIAKVARYKRYTVKLDGVYHEFISAYDFNKYVEESMELLKGKVCVVTGGVSINIYKGKISFRYQVQNIRELGENEEIEQKLVVRFDTFYRKEDVDLVDWNSNKEIAINAYTYQFIEKKDGNNVFKYIPTTFYINLANEENEKKVAFYLKQFGIVLDGSSIKTKIKDSEVVSLPVRCEYINGSQEVPFDENSLTDNQREMIELGLKTLDDFKPNGSIFGERIVKFYAIDIDARDKYADGYLVESIPVDEFKSEIFAFAAEEIKPEDAKDDDDIEMLFG